MNSTSTPDNKPAGDSYGQIVKSSSIMGGSAGIGLLIGMVRTKFAAVLIGTAGVGLNANFAAVQGIVGTVAGMGLRSSAVRDIARAVASDDAQSVGRAVLTLRRMCWITGLLGLVAMCLLSPWLSQWTFGSGEYTPHIAALGLVILLANLSGGQMALINGARRIADIARVNISSALIATVAAIVLYYLLGLEGIVPAMVFAAASRLAFSYFYSRRVPVPRVSMGWGESFQQARGMMKLGLAMMWTGLASAVAAYLVRALITQSIDLQAVGIYSAAFALSGMFVNFILSAMGSDYYPRLTSAAADKATMGRMVNEQLEVGILLATPGLLATLTFSYFIVYVFYTAEFYESAELLHWFILGCMGRLISWPLGFVMLALGKSRWLVVSETSVYALQVLLVLVGLKLFGIHGAAIAFAFMYLAHIAINYLLCRKLIRFSFTPQSARLTLLCAVAIMLTFLSAQYLSHSFHLVLGSAMTGISAVACLRILLERLGPEHKVSRLAQAVPGARWLFNAA